MTATDAGSTSCGADVAAAAAQLSRDLAASEEREHDLHEQLRFAEETNKTLRKKLADSDDEIESMSLQLRKLTSTKRSSSSKNDDSVEHSTQREVELHLQVELAEQEIGVLRRKLDAVRTDNENLLTAVKYLRAKLEPASTPSDAQDAVSRLLNGVVESLNGDELDRCRDELDRLRQRVAQVEVQRSGTVDTEGGTDTARSSVDASFDLQAECERLRRLVNELQRQDVSTDSRTTHSSNAGTGLDLHCVVLY